jgi:hypothetical protein
MPATTWGAPWLFLKSSDPPKLSKPARHSRPGRRFHPQRRLTAPPLLPLHPPPPVRLFAGLQFFLLDKIEQMVYNVASLPGMATY